MDGGAWKAAIHGVAEGRTRLSDFTFTLHFSCIGEGNGNPLQCSCLESPRDRGAWWAAVYGVTQSWTWLKWLSSLAAAAIPWNLLYTFCLEHKQKWCASWKAVMEEENVLFCSVISSGERRCWFILLLFVYLAESGLSCSLWTLSCGLWHLVPWPGWWNLCPLNLECES